MLSEICKSIVFSHGVWISGRAEGKVCPGSTSKTIRCNEYGMDIGWGCRSATPLCDLDLTFDLDIVTLSLKFLSRLYLGNY